MAATVANLLGGGLLGGIRSIISEFKLDPETKARLQLAVEDNAALIAQKELEMNARLVESVNATMRAEAGAEHWATWLWRPIVGLTFSAVVINNYVLLPYFAHQGLQPIVIPANLWTAMLVILGATAAGRSVEKVVSAMQGGGGSQGNG